MPLPAVVSAYLRSGSAQWTATLYVAAVTLGVSALLARRMGPEGFGNYFFILGLMTLLIPFQNAGFPTLMMREKTASTPALAALSPILPGLALGHLLTVSSALICGALLLLPAQEAATLSSGLFCFGAMALSQQLSAILKSTGNFLREGGWQIFARTLSAIPVAAVAMLSNPSPAAVFVAWGGGLLIAFWLFPRESKRPRPCFRFEPSVYRSTLGFVLIELATAIYHRIDIVMLHYILGNSPAVGHYAAAYRLFDGVLLLIAPIASICFRELRLRWQDAGSLRRLSGEVLFASAGIGILLAGCGYLIAPIAVRLLFGEPYAGASAETAAWLSLGFAFAVPNAILTQLAIATNRERWYAFSACICALLNILLNSALIPACGISGAAWAMILTEAGLGLTLYLGVIRRIRFSGPLS